MTDQNERAEITAEYLDKMMNRVRGLIAKAEDRAATPEEAASYRAKAEDLIAKYKIAEWGLVSEGDASIVPIVKRIDVVRPNQVEFEQALTRIFFQVADHCGVKARARWEWFGHYERKLIGTVVGFAVDVRFFEILFESAVLMLIGKLIPSIDPAKSDQENVYALRGSGLTRREVARLLWGIDTHASHAKVQRLYAAECAVRGENAAVQGREINAKQYRATYALAFAERLWERLWRARLKSQKEGGPAIELKGRKERVNERFYEEFPAARPKSAEENARLQAENDAYWANLIKNCKNCRPDEGYLCRAHRPREETKADRDKRWRANHSASARAGSKSGSEAADSVVLDRSTDHRTYGDRDVYGGETRAIG